MMMMIKMAYLGNTPKVLDMLEGFKNLRIAEHEVALL